MDALIWLLHAASPAGNYLAAVLQAFQHGDPCVERVIATESERVGAGQGEMFAAQQNVEFVARLVMPVVYGELFARTVSASEAGGTGIMAFVGLPFLVAAVLDMVTAQVGVPYAWNRLGFEPTWEQSGDTTAPPKKLAEVAGALCLSEAQIGAHLRQHLADCAQAAP